MKMICVNWFKIIFYQINKSWIKIVTIVKCLPCAKENTQTSFLVLSESLQGDIVGKKPQLRELSAFAQVYQSV